MSTADMLIQEGKIEGQIENSLHVIKKYYQKKFDLYVIVDLFSMSIDMGIEIINDLKLKNEL